MTSIHGPFTWDSFRGAYHFIYRGHRYDNNADDYYFYIFSHSFLSTRHIDPKIDNKIIMFFYYLCSRRSPTN